MVCVSILFATISIHAFPIMPCRCKIQLMYSMRFHDHAATQTTNPTMSSIGRSKESLGTKLAFDLLG